MPAKKMTKFVPAKNGFRFPNKFKDWVAFKGLTTPGRCGGMVYAALDYFHAGRKTPTTATLPANGSVLSTYIWQRQYTAATEHLWDFVGANLNVGGSVTSGVFNAGFTQWLPILKRFIEKGEPVMLGLVVPDGNPFNWGDNHFVLAVGFQGSGDSVVIFVYDPDRPLVTATLKPDVSAQRWILSGGDHKDKPWVTYFVDLDYKRDAPPPSLDEIKGKDWHGRNMTGQDLSDGDYRKANFKNTIFHGADLHLADLRETQCANADFSGANLGRTELTLADLDHTNFTGADLREAVVKGANLRGATLTGARMGLLVGGKAVFDGGRLIGADLSATELEGASMNNCKAWGARFNASNATGLSLVRSDVHGSDFRQAQLGCADLTNAKGNGADFSNSKLANAILQGAYLEGADFSHSILTNASLREADFHGADLSNANVDGADFTGANLEGADLSGTDLSKAKNVRR
ncbi:MAG: pentapeptide repeat-containing protein [Kofleriaceae bacterium]